LSLSPLIPISLLKQALHESDKSRVLRLVEGKSRYATYIAGCEREEFECLLVKHNGTWQQITYAT